MISLFQQYFPATASDYCYELWTRHQFAFKVARGRRTRLGDYRYCSATGHRITVNGTFNPYAFVFTYLHEVAHVLTQQQWLAIVSRRKVRFKPHGSEWRRNFQALMEPLLTSQAFPPSLHGPLLRHMVQPSATSGTDAVLAAAFRSYDTAPTSQKVLLAEVKQGEQFSFNGRIFVKEITRRTRALCYEIKTQRKYTVPEAALVEKASLDA